MGIVKAYDIRGVVPTEIDASIANKVGKAVVALTGAKSILIANDMRVSSPALEYALKYGIIGQGTDAHIAGLCSTPQFYWLLATSGYDAGIMITASHNPKEYNGFKICRKGAAPVSYETGLAELEQLLTKDSKDMNGKGIGRFFTMNNSSPSHYAQFIASLVSLSQQRKVVLDAGNGMAGHTLPSLLTHYPMLDIHPLYFTLDGTFPNHEANPIKEENLTVLKKNVLEKKADLGVAFDGDADRGGFVDEQGKFVSADMILCLLATDYLAKHPSVPIVYDVRSTKALGEAIGQHGGVPVVWKGGHSRIKHKMIEVQAPLGGEKSGHFFFKDFFSADCPDVAWLRVLQIMEERRKSLSELVESFKKYYGGEELNFPVPNDPQAVMKKVEQMYSGSVMYLDGLSMDMGEWWFNLRPSNTEPLLRLNIESKTQRLYEEKKKEVIALITGLS